jgi:exodeoxyribonuclease V
MQYTLSRDQAEALAAIGQWYKNKTSAYLTLGGYAGTGKTTLIAYLRKALSQHDENARVAFCAYTGKAARVLADRLKEQKVPRKKDSVSTIHSLIYKTVEDSQGYVVGWERKDELERDLIIVDEASMIDEAIWRDLMSYGIPILAVGDHGQLPPIGSSFNLMASPNLRLERIYRQMAESPIIEVATMARMTGEIPYGRYGDTVVKLDRSDPESGQSVQDILENWNNDWLVLCGYNKTRINLNNAIRSSRDFETPEPGRGDRVVCLRNDTTAKMFNGMTGEIEMIKPADKDPQGLLYEAAIALDGEDGRLFDGFLLREQFGAKETVTDRPPKAPNGSRVALFDFGYALTVHKAQGSQSQNVLLFEERFPRSSDEDWKRWLYTAVTRAEDQLVIVG